MKEIKEMTIEELLKEMDELCGYLYMTKEIGAYDSFEWNELDYWDADRRHHKISQEVFLRNVISVKAYNENEKVELADKNIATEKPIAYSNVPPKDLAGQIHGACFDYKDFDKKIMGTQIRERVYTAWNGIHMVIKAWIDAEGGEKDFLEYIRKNEVDETCWDKR